MTPRLYQRKSRWIRACSRLELDILRLLRGLRGGEIRPVLKDFIQLGTRIQYLGRRGEDLHKDYLREAETTEPAMSIANRLGLLEELSLRLADVARRRLGMNLNSFPVYYNTTDPDASVKSPALDAPGTSR